MPLAYRPPTTAPMLVPPMASMGMRNLSSSFSTPTWAAPRAPPPDSTSPMRGRACAATGSWAADGSARPHPSNPANRTCTTTRIGGQDKRPRRGFVMHGKIGNSCQVPTAHDAAAADLLRHPGPAHRPRHQDGPQSALDLGTGHAAGGKHHRLYRGGTGSRPAAQPHHPADG